MLMIYEIIKMLIFVYFIMSIKRLVVLILHEIIVDFMRV